MTYTILRIFSTQLLSLQLATMTPTTQPKNPSSRNPRTSCLKRVSHKGQEKRAGPKDALRRKRIPRSAKSKTKISLHDSTTVKTPPAKAVDEKLIAGLSPEEVEHARRDSSLPEEHVLAICTVAEPFPPGQRSRPPGQIPGPKINLKRSDLSRDSHNYTKSPRKCTFSILLSGSKTNIANLN